MTPLPVRGAFLLPPVMRFGNERYDKVVFYRRRAWCYNLSATKTGALRRGGMDADTDRTHRTRAAGGARPRHSDRAPRAHAQGEQGERVVPRPPLGSVTKKNRIVFRCGFVMPVSHFRRCCTEECRTYLQPQVRRNAYVRRASFAEADTIASAAGVWDRIRQCVDAFRTTCCCLREPCFRCCRCIRC